MHAERLERIGTAARLEPTAGRQDRRDPGAVDPDKPEQQPGDRTGARCLHRVGGARLVTHHGPRPVHNPPPSLLAASRSRRSAASKSCLNSALDAEDADGKARTINELPGGRVPSRSRTTCRSRRATRCRITEFPTALLTTKPTRAWSLVWTTSGESAGNTTCTTIRRPAARRPCLVTCRKSSLRVSRAVAGSTVPVASGRQVGAALASASGENRTAGTSAHAQAETVGLRPAAIVRLEGALAHGRISRSRLCRRRARETRPSLTRDPLRLRTRRTVTKSGFTPADPERSKSHYVIRIRDTPSTFGCLPCATSCGIARPLLACGLLVGEMGVGVPAAQLKVD